MRCSAHGACSVKVDDRRAHGPNPRHVRDALPRRPKSRRPVFSPDRASAHRAAPARRGARVSNDSFTVLLVLWDVVTVGASRDSFPPRFSWEDDPAARSSSKSVLSDAGSVGARHSLAQQESCG